MKYLHCLLFINLLFVRLWYFVEARCDLTPDVIRKMVKIQDKYIIELSGNPRAYVPREPYNITIKYNSEWPNAYVNKFVGFKLTIEHEYSDRSPNVQHPDVGVLYLIDDRITRFSSQCLNTVKSITNFRTSEVQVKWVAPKPGSGCVAIRAMVLEKSNDWYRDGGLKKMLCEETADDKDVQPPVLQQCCACDEAKYELAFHGIWSRNTHPKNFPPNLFTTKFSDLIGASHRIYRSFWGRGLLASEGLAMLAENGNSTLLENELKAQSANIRTIIKARELRYPNVTGTTYTVFRVDNRNHLVSVVSKLTPSPDWFVGVADLEMCQNDCTWVESRVLNLYPWDAGTDDGISYISPSSPASPPGFIRQISSNSPNDPASPFYSDDGEPLKPVARLILTRQKLYEKSCDEHSEENCLTTTWSEWSTCTPDCLQFRERQYIDTNAEVYCNLPLREEQPCCEASISEDKRCRVGEWSQWSSCSSKCGKGTKTRDRELKYSQFQTMCQEAVKTQENEECEGDDEDCSDVTEEPDECANTGTWSEWTSCNVTCGTGYKIRHFIENEDMESKEYNELCANQKTEQIVECYKECEGNSRIHPIIPESQTKYTTRIPKIISQGPDGPVINCIVSKWSKWSPCNTTARCEGGYKFRERFILTHPENGGTACPKKLFKRKPCQGTCAKTDSAETRPTWGPSNIKDERIDCKMSGWSSWSACSETCGNSGIRQRTRTILIQPNLYGIPCGPRKQEKGCYTGVSCP